MINDETIPLNDNQVGVENEIVLYVPDVVVLEEQDFENVIELSETPGPAHPETPVRTCQYRFSKQRIRASSKIETLVSSKSIEQRKSILSSFLENQQDSGLYGKITNHLSYLKLLYEKKDYKTFFETIHGVFPSYNDDIVKYIASKIGVRKWLLSWKYKES